MQFMYSRASDVTLVMAFPHNQDQRAGAKAVTIPGRHRLWIDSFSEECFKMGTSYYISFLKYSYVDI